MRTKQRGQAMQATIATIVSSSVCPRRYAHPPLPHHEHCIFTLILCPLVCAEMSLPAGATPWRFRGERGDTGDPWWPPRSACGDTCSHRLWISALVGVKARRYRAVRRSQRAPELNREARWLTLYLTHREPLCVAMSLRSH